MNSTMFKGSGDSVATRDPDTQSNSSHDLDGHVLAAPVRQAILSARQYLLNEQLENGSWTAVAQPNARLASQLILLHTFLGRDEEETIAALSASLRQQQLPTGGWAVTGGEPADVSTSVQAYLALKLAGDDPTNRVMRRARHEILAMGGADRGDAATRYLLALFGQIGYEHCPAMPPEMLLLFNRFDVVARDEVIGSWQSKFGAPMTALWSLRPRYVIGIDRGVRELFSKKPADWPVAFNCISEDVQHIGNRLVGIVYERFANRLEQWGITPLRSKSLQLLESTLTAPRRTHSWHALSLEEAIWHALGLTALGYSTESQAMMDCWARIADFLDVDTATQQTFIRQLDSRWAITAIAAQAAIESGLTPDNPAVHAAHGPLFSALINDKEQVRWRNLSTHDLANLASSIVACHGKAAPDGALPPAFSLRDESNDDEARFPTERAGASNARKIASQQIVRELVRRQHRQGGWSADTGFSGSNRTAARVCCPSLTGAVLTVLAGACDVDLPEKVEQGREFLFSAQRANGSWLDHRGKNEIRTTASAVRGLLAIGVPNDDPTISAAINWLRVQQLPTGGWNEMTMPQLAAGDLERQPCLQTTATALLALITAGDFNSRAVLRGVNLLVELQNPNGAWNEGKQRRANWAAAGSRIADLDVVSLSLLVVSRWAVAFHDHDDLEAPIELRVVGTH